MAAAVAASSIGPKMTKTGKEAKLLTFNYARTGVGVARRSDYFCWALGSRENLPLSNRCG